MLSERKRKLIEYLAEFDGWVSLRELAAYFSVSERTIRNDLVYIEQWLQDYGIQLERKIGKGEWQLSASKKEIHHLFNKVQDVHQGSYVHSVLERQLLITHYLLLRDTFVTLQEMGDELLVSKGTVLHDLEKVEEWLAPFQLKLDSSKRGYRVTGSERQKRQALLTVIQWLEYVWEDIHAINKLGWTQLTCQELDDLFHLLQRNFNNLFKSNEYANVHLYRLLVVLIQRIRQGTSVTPYLFPLQDRVYYNTVLSNINPLLKAVSTRFGLNLPAEEQRFIVQHLLAFCSEVVPFPKAFSETDINIFINRVLSRLGFVVRSSEKLQHLIWNECEQLRWQLLFELPHISPMFEKLSEEYGFVIDHVRHGLYELDPSIFKHVPYQQLTGLVMCFASMFEQEYAQLQTYKVVIVCPNGKVTSHLLASRLKKYFVQIEVVGIFSLSAIREIQNNLYIDFVISTVSISDLNLPVITVKPFLEMNEIEKIRRFIQDKDCKKNRLTEETSDVQIRELLDAEAIEFVDGNHVDLQQAIRQGVYLLEKQGVVHSAYFDDLCRVIDERGLYFEIVPGLLFPHAASNHVLKVGLSLVRLNHPIMINDRSIHAILTLATPDSSAHLPLLRRLHRFLMDPNNVQLITQGEKHDLLLEA